MISSAATHTLNHQSFPFGPVTCGWPLQSRVWHKHTPEDSRRRRRIRQMELGGEKAAPDVSCASWSLICHVPPPSHTTRVLSHTGYSSEWVLVTHARIRRRFRMRSGGQGVCFSHGRCCSYFCRGYGNTELSLITGSQSEGMRLARGWRLCTDKVGYTGFYNDWETDQRGRAFSSSSCRASVGPLGGVGG